MIEFYHVSKQYVKNVWVLNDITFSIKKGDFVFLTGVSGAGKTTLLKMIYKDEVPSKGQILIDSSNIGLIEKREVYRLRRDIGIIFQDFKLLHNRTIYENVALPLLVCGERKSLVEKRVNSSLSLVGLSHRRNYYPMHVSGGEQQRAAIARAIVANPKIIIADEPTGNLDTELSIEIFHIFERINANGITIVLATHDRHLLNIFPKRIISLDQGKITMDRDGGVLNVD